MELICLSDYVMYRTYLNLLLVFICSWRPGVDFFPVMCNINCTYFVFKRDVRKKRN
jgi:hypothetical protein